MLIPMMCVWDFEWLNSRTADIDLRPEQSGDFNNLKTPYNYTNTSMLLFIIFLYHRVENWLNKFYYYFSLFDLLECKKWEEFHPGLAGIERICASLNIISSALNSVP